MLKKAHTHPYNNTRSIPRWINSIPYLAHKALDDAVECGALEVQLLVCLLAHAFLARAQSAEIL